MLALRSRSCITRLSRWMAQVAAKVPAKAAAIIESPDVAIIGGGPGGYVAALRAAQLGLSVVCIEKRQTLGGTCLNVGCIPSKALLHSSHMYHVAASGELAPLGVKVTGAELDLKGVMKNKETAVRQLTGGILGLFKKKGVCHVSGEAKFGSNAKEILVNTGKGAPVKITPRYTIIATGSEATELPFLPFDEKTIVSSTGALAFPAVPKELVVIGAGVIGLELGSVWSSFGSKVTFVEFMPHIIPGADLEVSNYMKGMFEKRHMKFMMSTQALGANKVNGRIDLKVKNIAKGADGSESTLTCDAVLVCVGRKPYTKGLGLEGVGIDVDQKGFVKVNDVCETVKPGVFCIGDAITGPMLAHKASEDGEKVAELIAHKIAAKQDSQVTIDVATAPASLKRHYEHVPSVVYTSPEVGWVGLSQEAAVAKYGATGISVGKFPFMANGRSKACRETDGFVKIILDKATSRIVGAHIIHAQGGELLSELGLAISKHMTADDVVSVCHAHPTFSEAIKEACLDALGRPLHF